MLLEYELKVAEAKTQTDSLLSQIEKGCKRTETLFKKLIETLQKTEERKNHKSCVWLSELRFLNSAIILGDLERTLGEYVKEVWEQAVRLENLRINSVKKTMVEFLQLQQTVFSCPVEGVVGVIEGIEENNESLVQQRLFKQEEIRMMKEIGIEEGNVENLAKWKPENICEFDWVIKEGVVFMENGVFQQWQECYGVIVKSMFLHIFSSKPEFPFVEPLESLYLAQAKMMVSQSAEVYVEITENTRTGLLNKLVSGKQVVIKTKNPEELMTWMELIQTFNKE
jgi:hypothetical protein